MNKNLLAASAATLAMALTVASCGNASDRRRMSAMNGVTPGDFDVFRPSFA